MNSKHITHVFLAVVMASVGHGVSAQSLEKTYADMCGTPAKKATEACQVMARALLAKLQGDVAQTGSGKIQASASPAKEAVAPPSAAELRARWGMFLDFMDKPMFGINNETGVFDPAERITFAWKVPGEVMTRTTYTADGSVGKTLTYRWDDERGQVVLPIEGAGEMLFGTKADGDVIGLLPIGTNSLRVVFKRLADSFREVTDLNQGQGWVLKRQTTYLEATPANLASAPQMIAPLMKSYQINKSTAEDLAQMQGGRSDTEFQQYLAEVEKRNAARREEKKRRSQERSDMFDQAMGAVQKGLVVASGVATANEAASRARLEATMTEAGRARRSGAGTSLVPQPSRESGRAGLLLKGETAAPAFAPPAAQAAAKSQFGYCVAVQPGAYMDAPGAMFLSAISSVEWSGSDSSEAAEAFGAAVTARYGARPGTVSCNAWGSRALAETRWREQRDVFGLKFYKKVETGLPASH